MMTPRNQMHIVAVSIAVLFGVWTLIMTNSGGPITFASSPLSAAASNIDQAGAKMHLDEAMKALQAGDNAGAKMHMEAAEKVLSEGSAKMHLDEAMKALQAGDNAGAKMHAQAAQDSL